MLAKLRSLLDGLRKTAPRAPAQGEGAPPDVAGKTGRDGKALFVRLSCRERRHGAEDASGRFLSPYDWRLYWLAVQSNRAQRIKQATGRAA